MSISSVVSSPDGHTQVRTYTGITTDDVQASFAADQADAKRQGWVAVSQRWDASQPVPTLVIEYRHWPGPSRRRSKSRLSAVGVVAVTAVVLLVLASGSNSENEPIPRWSGGDQTQPEVVIPPDRISTPRPVMTGRPRATAPTSGRDESGPTNAHRVTRAQFGRAWPFRVNSGTLGCHYNAATFTDARGRLWALNGLAEMRGFPELDDSIWRDDQEITAAFREAFPGEKPPRAKVSVGEMIDLALELCDR